MLSSVELREGALQCLGCEARWPVVEGIPVLLRDAEPTGLLADLFSDSAPLLATSQPENAPLPHALTQLSTYLGAYESGFEELAGKLRALQRVPMALELGCSVGRGLVELASTAELAVGVDRFGAALRAAARILGGGELRYFRRVAGQFYEPAVIRAPRRDNVELICADALDPPLAPGGFQRSVALNLLDNVRSPRALLHHLHQLTAPGGEIVLSSPYAWRDGIVDAKERLGGLDPAAALRDEVRALGCSIEDDCDLRWTLRHDSRATTQYRVHYVRARRP
jgi:SAM-dependent methyltransferase